MNKNTANNDTNLCGCVNNSDIYNDNISKENHHANIRSFLLNKLPGIICKIHGLEKVI